MAELVIFDCDGARCSRPRGPLGVTGAKAAGMAAFGFVAATPCARLDGADAIFTTMADLPELVADAG